MSATVSYTPTKAELDKARAFLRERVGAEASMRADVHRLMERAAAEIARLAYSFNVSPRNFKFSRDKRLQELVDAIIEDLLLALMEDFETLAAHPDDENSDDILAWVLRERYGKTLEERLKDYGAKFMRELETGLGAAMFLGLAEEEALASIIDNLKHPYASEVIREAVKEGAGIEPPNYGPGRTNSMDTAITNLLTFGVAEGSMRREWEKAKANGAIGFVTFRNSSVPCDICDEYAGPVHPMDDPIPPLHAHCVCGVIYIYRKRQ